ncbi:MAG: PEP-CTERM sorting domain-containing protein [bacterium]|nr:PEP-CTERM sorting domain-containing protein [bacterium]
MIMLSFTFFAFCLVAGDVEATAIHGQCNYDSHLNKLNERCDLRRDHLAIKIEDMMKRFGEKMERFEEKAEEKKAKKEEKWDGHKKTGAWPYKWDNGDADDESELCGKIGKVGWLRLDKGAAKRDHMLEKLERRQARLERYCAVGGDGNNVIPEPASLMLLSSGLVGLLMLKNRRKG